MAGTFNNTRLQRMRVNDIGTGPWPRIAGVLYLVTIASGVFAEVFVRGSVIVRDDAAATAMNIIANESWYRLGLAADLVMLVCYVVVTGIFYYLFMPGGRVLSLVAAFFSLIGIAVLAANSINHFAPLVLLSGQTYLMAFDVAELQAAARTLLRFHGAGYTISNVFFGIYCITIGYLVFRSQLVPRVIGVLMTLGGVSFIGSSFLTFLAPTVATAVPDIALLGGLGELSLTLWLIGAGVRPFDLIETTDDLE